MDRGHHAGRELGTGVGVEDAYGDLDVESKEMPLPRWGRFRVIRAIRPVTA